MNESVAIATLSNHGIKVDLFNVLGAIVFSLGAILSDWVQRDCDWVQRLPGQIRRVDVECQMVV